MSIHSPGHSDNVSSIDELSDIVWGAEGIGSVINRSARDTFHLLKRGHLPAKKIGGRWAASRRKLLAHFAGEQA